jgi:hypothetical protein
MIILFFQGCTYKNQSNYQASETVETVTPSIDMTIQPTQYEQLKKLNRSISQWEYYEDTTGSNYQYTVRTSNWGGTKSQTTILVKDDFVQSRYYYRYNANNVITENWQEKGFDALNNHPQGAATKRMEELYEECKSIISRQDTVKLRFDGYGILKECSYGKRGIFINNFTFLRYK